MSFLFRAPLIAAAALVAGCAATDPNCPPSGSPLPPRALVGAWDARIGDDSTAIRLLLQPHPDYAGVRGQVLRGDMAAQVAGDINDQGLLLLDESEDGQRISATWEGEALARSCGRVFRGQWRRAGEDRGLPFELTRSLSTP